MIYLDNVIFSLQRAGGISMVWAELIKNLLYKNERLRCIEYASSTENIFRKQFDIPDELIQQASNFNRNLSQLVSPKVLYNKPFIFHSSYFRICHNPNAINVTTVHDFIYEQGVMTFKQKLRTLLNYYAIRRSDAIVCISENTKADLLKYLPDIDSNKIYVINNGVSDDYCKCEFIPYKQYTDYVLYVGGRLGYKNFDFVVRALANTDFKLLVCGTPLTDSEKLILEHYLAGKYVNLVYPSNEELNKIYNSVYCLAYPSSYEGFGIPVLEAQNAGCPVIALNTSSIPEIIGDRSLCLSKLNMDEFVALLSRLREQSYRKRIIDLGLLNANRYSWKKMADEYFNLYNQLLRKNK